MSQKRGLAKSLPQIPQVNGRTFLLKVLLLAALVGLGISAIHHATIPAMLIGWLVLGSMYAHAVELQHQCLHGTAFRSRRLNDVIGVVLGIPMLISYSEYQDTHLRHHRLVGTTADKESFDYDYASLKGSLSLVAHLLMIRHYVRKARILLRALQGRAVTPLHVQIRREHRLMLLVLAIMCGISIAVKAPLILTYWVLPLFLVAAPLHVLIELPEHVGCQVDTEDVFRNTRTIRAGAFARWFTNGNNYHVEHHWRAGYQVEHWGKVHQVLQGHIVFLEDSYFTFFRRFVHALRTARVNDPTYWATSSPNQALPGDITRQES